MEESTAHLPPLPLVRLHTPTDSVMCHMHFLPGCQFNRAVFTGGTGQCPGPGQLSPNNGHEHEILDYSCKSKKQTDTGTEPSAPREVQWEMIAEYQRVPLSTPPDVPDPHVTVLPKVNKHHPPFSGQLEGESVDRRRQPPMPVLIKQEVADSSDDSLDGPPSLHHHSLSPLPQRVVKAFTTSTHHHHQGPPAGVRAPRGPCVPDHTQNELLDLSTHQSMPVLTKREVPDSEEDSMDGPPPLIRHTPSPSLPHHHSPVNTPAVSSYTSYQSPGVPPTASSYHSPRVPPTASSYHSPGVPPTASSYHSPGVPPTASSYHSPGVPPTASSYHHQKDTLHDNSHHGPFATDHRNDELLDLSTHQSMPVLTKREVPDSEEGSMDGPPPLIRHTPSPPLPRHHSPVNTSVASSSHYHPHGPGTTPPASSQPSCHSPVTSSAGTTAGTSTGRSMGTSLGTSTGRSTESSPHHDHPNFVDSSLHQNHPSLLDTSIHQNHPSLLDTSIHPSLADTSAASSHRHNHPGFVDTSFHQNHPSFVDTSIHRNHPAFVDTSIHRNHPSLVTSIHRNHPSLVTSTASSHHHLPSSQVLDPSGPFATDDTQGELLDLRTHQSRPVVSNGHASPHSMKNVIPTPPSLHHPVPSPPLPPQSKVNASGTWHKPQAEPHSDQHHNQTYNHSHHDDDDHHHKDDLSQGQQEDEDQVCPYSPISSASNDSSSEDRLDTASAGEPGGCSNSSEGKSSQKKRPGRKKGQVSKVLHLWEFLLALLRDPQYCPRVIRWENEGEGVFRVRQSAELARLWGQKKRNKKLMTYEKLSRSLRYSRKEGFFDALPKGHSYPKKLCFKFGPRSHGWRKGTS